MRTSLHMRARHALPRLIGAAVAAAAAVGVTLVVIPTQAAGGCPDSRTYGLANLVVNGDLDCDGGTTQDPAGWSTWGDASAAYSETGGPAGHRLTHASPQPHQAFTSQVIGLPNGDYELTLVAKRDDTPGGAAYVEVENHGSEPVRKHIREGVSHVWQFISVPFSVTNGQAEVGLYTDSAVGGQDWASIASVTVLPRTPGTTTCGSETAPGLWEIVRDLPNSPYLHDPANARWAGTCVVGRVFFSRLTNGNAQWMVPSTVANTREVARLTGLRNVDLDWQDGQKYHFDWAAGHDDLNDSVIEFLAGRSGLPQGLLRAANEGLVERSGDVLSFPWTPGVFSVVGDDVLLELVRRDGATRTVDIDSAAGRASAEVLLAQLPGNAIELEINQEIVYTNVSYSFYREFALDTDPSKILLEVLGGMGGTYTGTYLSVAALGDGPLTAPFAMFSATIAAVASTPFVAGAALLNLEWEEQPPVFAQQVSSLSFTDAFSMNGHFHGQDFTCCASLDTSGMLLLP